MSIIFYQTCVCMFYNFYCTHMYLYIFTCLNWVVHVHPWMHIYNRDIFGLVKMWLCIKVCCMHHLSWCTYAWKWQAWDCYTHWHELVIEIQETGKLFTASVIICYGCQLRNRKPLHRQPHPVWSCAPDR